MFLWGLLVVLRCDFDQAFASALIFLDTVFYRDGVFNV